MCFIRIWIFWQSQNMVWEERRNWILIDLLRYSTQTNPTVQNFNINCSRELSSCLPRFGTCEYGKLPLGEQKRPHAPCSSQAQEKEERQGETHPRGNFPPSFSRGRNEWGPKCQTVKFHPQRRKHQELVLNFLSCRYQELTNKLKGAF